MHAHGGTVASRSAPATRPFTVACRLAGPLSQRQPSAACRATPQAGPRTSPTTVPAPRRQRRRSTLHPAPRRRHRDRHRPPTGPAPPRSAPARRPTRLGAPGAARLLGATALLYLWGLGASGWANSFYSAAAQAGSESGRRCSSAPPTPRTRSPSTRRPLSLWLMALSVRVFGLSSLEHPGAAGARWASPPSALLYADGPPYDGLGGRRSARGRRARAHPGGRADVPVQQPGRAAGAAAGRRGLRHRCARVEDGRATAAALAGLGGALVGLGLPDQDAAGVPGAAGRWPGLPASPRRPAADAARHLLVAFGAMVVAAGWWVAIV